MGKSNEIEELSFAYTDSRVDHESNRRLSHNCEQAKTNERNADEGEMGYSISDQG